MSAARATAPETIRFSNSLPNYRRNWIRLGFTEADIDELSDRFVDALVAWGNAETILRRVREHYDAGATHVCIQLLSAVPSGAIDWACLESLAPTG